MFLDYFRLFRDYNIEHNPSLIRGYVQVRCPLCGDEGHHGAFHAVDGFYTCWKCGTIPSERIWKAFFRTTNYFPILKKYKREEVPGYTQEEKIAGNKNGFLSLPGSNLLNEPARKYLLGRNFDPDYLQHKYKIRSTFFEGDYDYRIIIPIFHGGVPVSFIGRDYTGKSRTRYKACELKDEVIHHKEILFGEDTFPGDKAVIVEGAFDKMRLGDYALATFGTGFTLKQVHRLSKIKKIFTLYDSEPEAQKHAVSLGKQLSELGCEVYNVVLSEGDPAELSEENAKNLIREIIFRGLTRKNTY